MALAYTAIPDDDVDANSPLTTTVGTLFRDNPIAIAEGAAGAPRIVADALDTDSVETAKIENLAVTAVKLATDAVETAKIDNFAVETAKIDNFAVTNLKLAADAVETPEIKNEAVTGPKIADGAIEQDHFTVGVYRVLFSDTVEEASVGSGETTLMTFTMNANQMPNNGDSLRITAYFKGDGVNDVTLKVYFGAGAQVVSTLTPVRTEEFGTKTVVEVIRIASTAQRLFVQSWNVLGILQMLPGSPGETHSGTIVIKFTGQNTTNTDNDAVIQRYMKVEFLPRGDL